MCDMVTQSDVTKSRKLEARLPTKCLRSNVFCGREDLLFAFLVFTIFYMHKNICKTLKEMEKTKTPTCLI